jgi:biopolymer transport protein ExbB
MKHFAGAIVCLLAANAAFGVNITDVRAGAKRDLDGALKRLAALRQQVEKEKLPLVRELNALERDAREKREEFDRRLRLRDNRDAGLIELRREVEEAETDMGANLGLLRDYVRSWRNGLPNPQKAQLAEPLAKALTIPATTSSAAEDLAAEIRVTRLSLKALQASYGGQVLEGETIVPPEGARKSGTFLTLGPLTFFAEPGGASGIVEKPQRGDEGDLTPALARNTPPARLLTTPEEIASIVQLALAGNSESEIILPLDPTLGKALVMETGEPTLLEELGKGGIWIYPILVFAGVSVIIAFFKAIQILRVRAPARAASLEGSFTGPFEQLRIAAKENMGRKAEILEEILYERIIDAQVRLEKALPLIAVTAATAPLLGLLGTVTGMIDVFRQITNFANPESSELARGISEALVTTKFGLITAIPSLIVHALLSRRLQGLVAKMETFASRLVNLAANGNGDQPSVEKIEEETKST